MAFFKKKSTNDGESDEMSFLDHLEQLRWHIMRSLLAIVIVAIAVFLAKDLVFSKIILAPIRNDFITYQILCKIGKALCVYPEGVTVYTRQLGEQFVIHLKTSFWLGLIVSFPYVFYEFWTFIKPGLYDKERAATRGVVFICSSLFLLGVLFGYYIISPFAITFLSSYSVSPDVANTFTLSSLVDYMTMFTLPTGLIFQMPVVMYFLAKIGIVTPQFLRQYRKHAIIIILILGSIITPPDVITQILISMPLMVLYEVSIIVAKRVEKQQNLKKE
jgi:sec-independent protein translocase protein TatC